MYSLSSIIEATDSKYNVPGTPIKVSISKTDFFCDTDPFPDKISLNFCWCQTTYYKQWILFCNQVLNLINSKYPKWLIYASLNYHTTV